MHGGGLRGSLAVRSLAQHPFQVGQCSWLFDRSSSRRLARSSKYWSRQNFDDLAWSPTISDHRRSMCRQRVVLFSAEVFLGVTFGSLLTPALNVVERTLASNHATKVCRLQGDDLLGKSFPLRICTEPGVSHGCHHSGLFGLRCSALDRSSRPKTASITSRRFNPGSLIYIYLYIYICPLLFPTMKGQGCTHAI